MAVGSLTVTQQRVTALGDSVSKSVLSHIYHFLVARVGKGYQVHKMCWTDRIRKWPFDISAPAFPITFLQMVPRLFVGKVLCWLRELECTVAVRIMQASKYSRHVGAEISDE